MAHLAIPLLIGGTALGAAGSLMQGQAASKSASFTAKQLERNANAAKASSQRQAVEDRRKADIIQSRARAVAAAGGGTTTGVGVSDILSKIDAEGEFNALSSLFEGKQQAAGLKTKASAARLEGKMAKRAATIGALGTVMSGGSKAAARMG